MTCDCGMPKPEYRDSGLTFCRICNRLLAERTLKRLMAQRTRMPELALTELDYVRVAEAAVQK